MKINLLYILIPAAIFGCYWIINDLQGQSEHSFFGTAESEPQMINFEHDILVQDVRVALGNEVKKGDTLAVLYRAELDKTTVDKLADINMVEVEKTTKSSLLNKEKDVLLARQAARLSELISQIKVLRTEDSIKNSVKTSIYNNIVYDNKLVREKIAALEDEIRQSEKQTIEQIRQIESQQQASQLLSQARVAKVQKDLNYITTEKGRLILMAPIDGFMEQVNVTKGSLVQAYKDLFKINPKKPNKIVGFIHESTDIPFQLGDSVKLQSAVRASVLTQGVIIGSNPKLVELPYRLRKFTELRAWGREVYILMPDNNGFYIGEKIILTIETPPLSIGKG